MQTRTHSGLWYSVLLGSLASSNVSAGGRKRHVDAEPDAVLRKYRIHRDRRNRLARLSRRRNRHG